MDEWETWGDVDLGAIFGGEDTESNGGGVLDSVWDAALNIGQGYLTSYFSPALPGPAPTTAPRALPVLTTDTGGTVNGDGNEGGFVQVGWPAAAAAGALWLGRVLGGVGRAGGAIWRGTNGVQVRMRDLWGYVTKYGPGPVAAALGIGGAALGALLASPEAIAGRRGGRRGRGRGISARDVKTTKRTLKSIRKLYRMMPTRPSSSSYGGGPGYRPYYGRRRRWR